ncbi:DUF4019 domain-containing protein [Burkholderia vietnamiensis]|uniref:DUF4019 domain-containing protein n=1 Tax=Burkholderia vietnamiensis TaxID=60552 RepID=UPI001E461071|nr:DUF4019 domain-containing protein [Burkholderia vietnamiensis]
MKRTYSTLLYAMTLAIGLNAPAQAQPGTSADELVRDADLVVKQLDAGQYEMIWRQVAPFVRLRTSQSEFVAPIKQVRQAMGPITQRGWASVTRIVLQGSKDVPSGMYANVDYVTTLASGKVVFEQVSFRLEGDTQWHLTGYASRSAQQAKPPAAAAQ